MNSSLTATSDGAPVLAADDIVAKRHLTMAEAAAEQLHRAIVSGDIQAGTHLRIVDLAERLNMSPMPVRQALRRLEALGMVEVHAYRGAFVRELTRADFEDTMDIRTMLERAAVERAATRFTDAHAHDARQALSRYAALMEADQVVEAREAHSTLHFCLYRAAGSAWLVHAIEAVWRNSERYRHTSGLHESGAALEHEHEPILNACVKRDPDRAGRALEAHLAAATARMSENVPPDRAEEESLR